MHIHAPFSHYANSILCQLQLPFGVVFYDSMPSDEEYYEGGSYGYGGQYYPATRGCDPCPAGIAHEMLHAFGAPDLYCADVYGDNYGVSEDQAYRNLFQY